MTTLTIRNVDTRTRDRLRVRAARRGHSMEAALRAIPADALARDDEETGLDLVRPIRARFAPFGEVVIPEHPGPPAL
ncbi:FitA-like ribbon-helix-helix domain-containing protein [Rhodopila sp.]|uniref:FitA-like ribbon-helix-helix domain-containing protein n=1 Tax=Rhodopila sp. TaxID=2480087 RepID=UPI0038D07809